MNDASEITGAPATRQAMIAALTAPGQPYEVEIAKVHGSSLKVFKHAPQSLRELYAQTVTDKTFIVYDDERLTFAQAHTAAARIAHLLVNDHGVKKGDRVAISMRNYPEWILAFTAATSIGAIAVALNAMWQPQEMEYGLRDCGAKVLFADQERLDRLAEITSDLDVAVIAVRPAKPDARDLKASLSRITDVPMPVIDIEPDAPAMILYTSGSTGDPKGVVSTHRNVLTALLAMELDFQVALCLAESISVEPVQQPASLLAAPLFHAIGLHAIYLNSYRSQRKIVSMYKWNTMLAVELIEREKITTVLAPPAMTGDLVREARRTDRDLSSLTVVGGGGAARAPEQVKQIAESFENAAPSTGWAMTETNCIGASIGGLEYLNRPTSSGRCSSVLELKVVDEIGSELPANQRGELLVRGTTLFQGYWNRPELNAELFVDGWFRTGDVAHLDDDGYLFIVDRIKDLIIRGGENIGCGQVEAALLEHPDVHEAAVYAVPDDRLGEEVGATIYGAPSVNADAVRTFIGQRLARFQVPRYIQIATAPLPRTASGKIFKRQLRDEAIAVLMPKTAVTESTDK